MFGRITLCILTLLLIGTGSSVQAAILNVQADGGGTYPDLAAAVWAASNGDTIQLAPGTYTGAGNRDLDISRNLLFTAPGGATIDCQGAARAAYIENSLVTLQNLTVRGGSATNGGAFWLNDESVLNLESCWLIDNESTGEGGAIHAELVSEVHASGTVFTGNHAGTDGGAIYLETESYGNIVGSTLVMNSAGNWGSATFLITDSSMDLDTSIIAFNRDAEPCADYYSANYTATCTDVYGNEAGNWTWSLQGMNGVNGNVSVDPLFCDPMADPMNLALCASSPVANAAGCGLMGAFAADPGWTTPVYGVAADGGGMFPTVQDAIDAAPEGATVKLEDGVYTGAGNTHLGISKVLKVTSRSGVEENCIIDCQGSPPATEVAGFFVVATPAGRVDITDLTVRNGYMSTQGGGANVYAGGDVLFARCIFENNTSGTYGGAIRIYGNGTTSTDVTIAYTDFVGNQAADGGAVHGSYWNGQCNVSLFQDNTATNGGALALDPSNVDVNGCEFIDNTASQHGGAVRALGGSPDFGLCEFSGNEAQLGGAIYDFNADLTFQGCGFHSNYAIDDGGALYAFPSVLDLDIQITGSTFADNRAGQAGSVSWVYEEVTFALNESTLYANVTYDPDPATASQMWFGYDNVITMDSMLMTDGIVGVPVLLSGGGNLLTLTNCDVWNNGAGDYVGDLAGMQGTGCNVSADPIHCDPGTGDLTLRSDSPCLPANNPCGTTIGAWGEGCTDPTVDVPVAGIGSALWQNTPNPFNPSTEIAFRLERTGPVRLVVFDTRGREVARLVDGVLEAGEYVRSFTPRNLSSGLYLYRLVTPEGTFTRHMTLIK